MYAQTVCRVLEYCFRGSWANEFVLAVWIDDTGGHRILVVLIKAQWNDADEKLAWPTASVRDTARKMDLSVELFSRRGAQRKFFQKQKKKKTLNKPFYPINWLRLSGSIWGINNTHSENKEPLIIQIHTISVSLYLLFCCVRLAC